MVSLKEHVPSKIAPSQIAALLCFLVAFAFLIASVVNRIAQKRLSKKLSRCLDAVQRSLPIMERAAKVYLKENHTEVELDLD